MKKLTKKQKSTLLRKWKESDQGMSFLEFRRSAFPLFCDDSVIMVEWCGMTLGIETDGHCHS
jgi:hypothetical protein